MKTSSKKEKQFSVGKVIAVILILACVLTMMYPDVLIFLSEGQREVLRAMYESYFQGNLPFTIAGKGFDWMRIVALLMVGTACYWTMQLLDAARHAFKGNNHQLSTFLSVSCNFLRYAVGIYGIIFCLNLIGINMAAVVASLGVVGLVVGFGAESLIADIVSGIFIIFENQFQVGDIVTIDDFRGTVTDIGLRSTRLTDRGGNIKIINNSYIGTVINQSANESAAIADVCISHATDLLRAEKVVKNTLEKLPHMYPDVFQETPVYDGVESLADGVDMRIVAKVEEKDIYTAVRIINRELKLATDLAGIELYGIGEEEG